MEDKTIFKSKKRKFYKDMNSNNTNMLPGDPSGSPDESFFKNKKSIDLKDTLIFIDEAFLSKLSKHFGNGEYIRFDRFDFAKKLSERERLNLKKVFLYIAPPFQSPIPSKDEEIKREGYDRLIIKLKEKGIIISEGRCQRLKIDGEFQYNQKAVDILLAMDLMNIPLKYHSVKNIILISSDSDFVPIIQNLKEHCIKTILYTYYEKIRNSPFSRSNYLIKSVHKYVLLSKEDLESCSFNKIKYSDPK